MVWLRVSWRGECTRSYTLSLPIPLHYEAAHGSAHEGHHVPCQRRRANNHQANISSNLLPHKPEDKEVPDRVLPDDSFVQFVCLVGQGKVEDMPEPVGLVSRSVQKTRNSE